MKYSIFPAILLGSAFAAPFPARMLQEEISVDFAFGNAAYFGLKARNEEPVKDGVNVDNAFISIVYNGLKKRSEEADGSVDSTFVNAT
ncbi:hypothetical protein GRF29_19g2302674 [Pseudopithomyces chartarum]|uniref:Uncharacterized protein n=1 Tax=Pseudopithomyces chartarum TaxID=1892770 RepID=A0AAN6M3H3_9PLEO|nr:hypothetical protein GRF29_19g2302674 [Pseudopithomyces chartarum]